MFLFKKCECCNDRTKLTLQIWLFYYCHQCFFFNLMADSGLSYVFFCRLDFTAKTKHQPDLPLKMAFTQNSAFSLWQLFAQVIMWAGWIIQACFLQAEQTTNMISLFFKTVVYIWQRANSHNEILTNNGSRAALSSKQPHLSATFLIHTSHLVLVWNRLFIQKTLSIN